MQLVGLTLETSLLLYVITFISSFSISCCYFTSEAKDCVNMGVNLTIKFGDEESRQHATSSNEDSSGCFSTWQWPHFRILYVETAHIVSHGGRRANLTLS